MATDFEKLQSTTIKPFYQIEQKPKEFIHHHSIESVQYNIRWLGGVLNFNDTLLEAMCEIVEKVYADGDDTDIIGVEIMPLHMLLLSVYIPYSIQEELSVYHLMKAIVKDGAENGYKYNDDLRIKIIRIK